MDTVGLRHHSRSLRLSIPFSLTMVVLGRFRPSRQGPGLLRTGDGPSLEALSKESASRPHIGTGIMFTKRYFHES